MRPLPRPRRDMKGSAYATFDLQNLRGSTKVSTANKGDAGGPPWPGRGTTAWEAGKGDGVTTGVRGDAGTNPPSILTGTTT